MKKPARQLARFEELWLEQMQPLNAERLLNQINFVESQLERLIAYLYSDENTDYCLIYRLKSYIRRTLRNVARFTVSRGKKETEVVFSKSNARMMHAGYAVSIFDSEGCEDPNTNLPRRTYCVFQSCHETREEGKDGKLIVTASRAVDKITTDVQVGIDMYEETYKGEVLFVPDPNEKEDIPKNIRLFDCDKFTISDIEWLRNNQDHYGIPIAERIQRAADNGELGITRGIHVKVIDDYVYAYQFIVELRHIY
jgi:hypothetical protein